MIPAAWILALLIADPAAELSDRERVYAAACVDGISFALEGTGSAIRDDIRARSLLSCRGSLLRMRKTGALATEPEPAGVGCGYGITATMSKLGLEHEVQPAISPRVTALGERCIAKAIARGARPAVDPALFEAQPDRTAEELVYLGACTRGLSVALADLRPRNPDALREEALVWCAGDVERLRTSKRLDEDDGVLLGCHMAVARMLQRSGLEPATTPNTDPSPRAQALVKVCVERTAAATRPRR